MFLFRLVSVLLLIGWSSANINLPPVTAYEYLDTSHLGIGNSQIKLKFKAFNSSYTLYLKPSSNLYFTDSLVEVHTKDRITRKPISHFGIFPYTGDVVIDIADGKKVQVGWARITFHTDPKDTKIFEKDHVFEGAFESNRDGTHHIKTIESYRLSRRSMDIDIPIHQPEQHRRAGMIIFRDIDANHAVKNMDSYTFLSANTCPVSALIKRSNIPSDPNINRCGTDELKIQLNTRLQIDAFMANKYGNLSKRQTIGCPAERLIMPTGVAADCTYVAKYGGTQGALRQILSNWNSATQVYESAFNFGLGVVSVKLFETCGGTDDGVPLNFNQLCSTGYSINSRLSDFSDWRGKKAKDIAGLWHLLSLCNSGSTVGIAWLGTSCAVESYQQVTNGVIQWVTGVAVSTAVPAEWKVIAHETGHNFGAIHDCTSSDCPVTCTDADSCSCCPCGAGASCNCGGNFIMNPTDNSKTDRFSSCSVTQICGKFPSLGKCLRPADQFRTLQTGICGNGLKEVGEECDCGEQCATDNCCDGTTCKLKPPAVCDDINDACCSSCQLKQKSDLCRSSVGTCDYPEFCDGVSSSCPTNAFAVNGASCSSNITTNTICASGVCTNRDLQCRGYSSLVRITGACSDTSSCSLTCQDEAGRCYALGAFFLDGTPCGLDGLCTRGVCEGGSIVSVALNWIRANPQISIPILAIVGIIVLLILASFVRRCCFSRKLNGARYEAR